MIFFHQVLQTSIAKHKAASQQTNPGQQIKISQAKYNTEIKSFVDNIGLQQETTR